MDPIGPDFVRAFDEFYRMYVYDHGRFVLEQFVRF